MGEHERSTARLRVLILGPAHSIHVRRWIRELTALGVDCAIVVDRVLPEGWTYQAQTWNAPMKRGPFLLSTAINMLWLAYRVHKENIHNVHVHSLGRHCLLSMLLPGHRLIVSPWGSDVYRHDQRYIASAFKSLTLRRCRAVLTTSSAMRIQLITGWHVHASRIRTISWGVDTKLFRPVGSVEELRHLRRAWNFSDDAYIVVSPRGTSPTYRAMQIVEAVIGARDYRPDIFLVVVRGWQPSNAVAVDQMNQYHEAIVDRSEGFNSVVQVIDEALTEAKMAELLRMANAVISIPATDQRSATVLEAIASGVLVIGSDIPVYRELVADGVALTLVDEPVHLELERVLATRPELSAEQRERNITFIRRSEVRSDRIAEVVEAYSR